MRSRSRPKRTANSGRLANAPPLFSSVGVRKRTRTRSSRAILGSRCGSRSRISGGRAPPSPAASRVELFHPLERNAAVARPDSLRPKRGKRLAKILEHPRAQVEDMHVEAEGLAYGDGAPVQTARAQHEGPRPIPEAAGSFAQAARRLEEARVGGRRSGVAQHHPQGAADHVAALARRKVHRVDRPEMKAESVELELGRRTGRVWHGSPVV